MTNIKTDEDFINFIMGTTNITTTQTKVVEKRKTLSTFDKRLWAYNKRKGNI